MDEAVTVSMVETSAEAHEAAALLGRIWSSPRPIVPADLLFALVRVRNYAALARVGPEVVGASVAIRGVSGGGSPLLHSHVTGTTRPGVGRILKEHQRQWALAEGLPTITWTVDPLLRRNAVFNLDVLGARVDGYRVNHYGSMTDGRNSGEESDRFCVVWDLDPASPAGALPAGEAPTMGRPARPSPE
ncbi:MAG TPA: hypothetical protein VHM65_10585, partial [Candidatus Lustribacter sp.]|nr:hypothetical protein [Candidatus Lustribacter sp.]